MIFKTQILENKATDEKLLEVTVEDFNELTAEGKNTWRVLKYRIQVNAFPPTNNAPIYDTVVPTEDFRLDNYFGTDTYTMRKA